MKSNHLAPRECSVPTPASKHDAAAARPAETSASSPSKRQKLPALLVTTDDSLWTQIGTVGEPWVPRQVDSVDDLIASSKAGQTAVVLWDARGQAAVAAVLSRIQLHSDRYVIVALDAADNTAAWETPLAQRQVAAHLTLPIVAADLTGALERAREELNTRVALLGDGSGATQPPPRVLRRRARLRPQKGRSCRRSSLQPMTRCGPRSVRSASRGSRGRWTRSMT